MLAVRSADISHRAMTIMLDCLRSLAGLAGGKQVVQKSEDTHIWLHVLGLDIYLLTALRTTIITVAQLRFSRLLSHKP